MEAVQPEVQKALSRLLDGADLRRIAAETLRRDSRPVVAGLGGSAKALFAAALWQVLRRPLLIMAADAAAVEDLVLDVRYFHARLNGRPSGSVLGFPPWDVDFYAGLSPHADVGQARASALWQLRAGGVDILASSPRAVQSRLPLPGEFDAYALHLQVGDELSQELVLEHLATAGYVPREPVAAVGEFSRRGGIVDVFSPLMEWPVRLEFFGDSIDSIRRFDPDDQRSKGPVGRIDLLPMQERLTTREMLRAWAAAARRRWEDEAFRRDLNEKLALADDGEPFPGHPFLVPAAFPLQGSLLDYLEDAVLVIDEPEAVDESFQRYAAALEKRHAQAAAAGAVALAPSELFLPREELEAALARRSALRLEELGADGAGFVVTGQPVRRFHGRMREMAEAVRQSFEAGLQVILLGGTLGMAERLRDVLREYEVPHRTEFGAPATPAARSLREIPAPLVAVGRLSRGFRLPDCGVELFAEPDILDETERTVPANRRRSAAASFLSGFQDLRAGDFVVHIDHGIGRYEGVATVHDRECMILSYQDANRLYVPLERLDLIQKYSAAEGSQPRLDRLGGTAWVQRKSRVRRAIRDMAEQLLRLYAERKVAWGHAFPPDNEWQREFEEAFQYEETADQMAAIADIKRDMEADTPMDRLVCGDVGYGKTEVAMRAAFKAVTGHKQVAVLSPTTVLCFQHYETLKERFAAFPVKIAMLSRFVAPKEQKQVVEDVASGRVDVLVGTHRILSQDVGFQDLGLLIVDEEQRFGVAHKERLKELKKQVDVLTMTATPIPRTLHMALTGLRDMSVIETPPRDRLAIHTSVVKFNPEVIRNAIDFELDRGGQVYFVHNRVESIYSLASFVQRICPRARVEVGHGQMTERELERVMLRFMRHEFDVLVATTIIENGLDIPAANTLVVNRADRFGLAQLYQLRGRVGRSSRRAYAYLLIPPDQTLTPIARRRLSAIREFSELGAGFRIAALDLELRGAGTLLGGEQHGHIEAIGFDLYCQMLERAMEELRTGEAPPEVETAINLKAELKIPEAFVPDEPLRLRIYKDIASCRSEEEIESRYRDLTDRLGVLPPSIENLLEYARLRILGRALGVRSMDRKRDTVDIVFDPEARIDPERVVALVEAGEGVSFAPPATLRLNAASRSGPALFEAIQNVLRELS